MDHHEHERTAERMGMRRIGWVRVVVGPRSSRAEVSGIGHRLPRVVPVPLAVAASLAADGVPLFVHREQPC